ncbi:MAG TPA: helix-turn-helix transcriptional regulator [Fimbriimonas sp.]|nr:helix-turn-helix transcriptional regulator [Fimbriimonas sp.]
MNKIDELLEQLEPEKRLFYDWQFALAQRLVQIMDEHDLSQRELARKTRLTEAQVSAFIHGGANPNLSTLARISALLDAELLKWKNTDLEAMSSSTQRVVDNAEAAIYQLDDSYETCANKVLEPFELYRPVAQG